jgi:hypothetical protein
VEARGKENHLQVHDLGWARDAHPAKPSAPPHLAMASISLRTSDVTPAQLRSV